MKKVWGWEGIYDVCMYVCMYVRVSMCVRVHMYVCTYVRVMYVRVEARIDRSVVMYQIRK